MKNVIGMLLGAMLLVACNPGGDKKPVMERATLDKARQMDSTLQQQAQQQQQETDKQAQ